MVEVANLPVEHERVGVLAEVLRHQVGVAVAARMASIGSSLSYELRSPMISESGSPLPVGSVASQSTRASAASVRVPLQLPEPSPVSGSPTSLQSDPFDLRWLTATVNRPPVAISSKVWASTGRLLVSMNRGSTVESRMAMAADRHHRGGAVDDPHLDGVGTDGPGVDGGVRSGPEDVVEPVDQVLGGVDAGSVLDLIEPDDVGVELAQRRQQLDPLPHRTPRRCRRRDTPGSAPSRRCQARDRA